MPNSLFITGASGFIGSRLLEALEPGEFEAVRLLSRGSLAIPDSLRAAGNAEVVRGDLEDPRAYASWLDANTTVVHAAAVTGTARPKEYEAVNVRGLARLLETCEQRGVRRFLHLSTIAVCYPDLEDYPYARSKFEAEALVRSSGLDYTIVRPTVVLGPRSAPLQNLLRLAAGPALLIPGTGRARLRPIDLDDLLEILLGIVRTSRFQRETFDLGGPEALSCEDFLRRIRRAVRGSEGPVIRLPLGLLLPCIRALERVWPGVPPVSAGQFAVFRFDGVGRSDESLTALAPRLVDAMLARALEARPPDAEAQAPDAEARRECETFSRYLLGRPPDAYLLRKYCEASRFGEPAGERSPFEDLLLRLATRHPLVTRAVDAYARWFCPRALLRKKLILVLAIAESWAPSYVELDRADGGGRPVFVARFAAHAIVSGLLLSLAVLLLQPVRLLLWARQKRAGSRP
jgi:NADH dehydrogenase